VSVVKVEAAWKRQREWSNLAGAEAKPLRRLRLANLYALVIGAVLGAVAVQAELLDAPQAYSRIFGGASAAALVVASFIQRLGLTPERYKKWQIARAASESLKGVIFQYRVGVAPYDAEDREKRLDQAVADVRKRATGFDGDLAGAGTGGKEPPERWALTIQEYIDQRAREQEFWHRDEIREHARAAKWWRRAEIAATVLAALLAIPFFENSLATPLVAVFTTLSAVFAAHLVATGHARIVNSYGVVVGDLKDLTDAFDPEEATGDEVRDYVRAVEGAIAAQNEGWSSIILTTATTGAPGPAGEGATNDA
jgi:hypothetical protein